MIRQAELKDLNTIAAFNDRLARETEHMNLDMDRLTEGVRAVLQDGTRGRYYVYEAAGQVAGQLMITLEWSDWRNGFFWWIQSVYVERAYRGKGIFKALYHHVKDLAEEDDEVCGLRLYVEGMNTGAQQVYKKAGMVQTGYCLYELELQKK